MEGHSIGLIPTLDKAPSIIRFNVIKTGNYQHIFEPNKMPPHSL